MGQKPQKLEIELDPELVSGQMIVTGFEGTELPGDVEAALRDGRLSGVILFAKNRAYGRKALSGKWSSRIVINQHSDNLRHFTAQNMGT